MSAAGPGVSEMRLEEGAGRFDVNVSIRFTEDGEVRWPPQSEIKNLNSYAAIREAAPHEAERLWRSWQEGGELRTRTGKITVGWSPERRGTFLQRSKEDVEDYRYFPDPDLLPLVLTEEEIERVRASLPELPEARRERFIAEYGLSGYQAAALTANKATADYFETTVRGIERKEIALAELAKPVANWVTVDLAAKLNADNLEIGLSPVSPERLAKLLLRVLDRTLSNKMAKEVFDSMWAGEGDPDAIIDRKGLRQISDAGAIEKLVDEVLAANAKQVEDFRAGKGKAFNSLVGQVMKASKGKANPELVNQLLKKKLSA